MKIKQKATQLVALFESIAQETDFMNLLTRLTR